MRIEKENAWFKIHADPSAVRQSAFNIQPQDGGFIVTISTGSIVVIVECSADNLAEVLAMFVP